jgi:hypothetical protein
MACSDACRAPGLLLLLLLPLLMLPLLLRWRGVLSVMRWDGLGWQYELVRFIGNILDYALITA